MNKQVNQIKKWLQSGSINLFGSPFSGKDTQSEKLADLFDGVLIGGGEILRSYHDQEELASVMAQGDLIPSETYLNIMVPYLSQEAFNNKPLILSSVGRMKGEEKTILKGANKAGHTIKAVVLLGLSEDEVWARYEAAKQDHDRGDRDDDKKSVLKNRIAKYLEQTTPVIDYYRHNGLLVTVNGNQERQSVTRDILQGLADKAAGS